MTDRPGFVLLYSVLLILALSVLSVALMAVAAREGSIARAHVRLMQARAAAESAVRVAVSAWPPDIADLMVGEVLLLTPMGTEPGPAGAAEVEVTRLSSSLYMARAETVWSGVGGAGAATAGGPSAEMLVRTVEPTAAVASFPAAVTADSLAELHEAVVSGWDVCASAVGSLPGVLAPQIDLIAAVVDGQPPVQEVAPEPRPVDGPLAPSVVAAIRDILVTGVGTPTARASGAECLTDPWNWGATSPSHPCYTLLPLVASEGDLVVEGGDARAILVASGDVRLDGPMTFEGLILASGRLVIGADARVRGVVRAHQVIGEGGEVVLDRCAQLAVLQAPAFRTPLQHGSRLWIPSFQHARKE